jgi:hypothetical protein
LGRAFIRQIENPMEVMPDGEKDTEGQAQGQEQAKEEAQEGKERKVMGLAQSLGESERARALHRRGK